MALVSVIIPCFNYGRYLQDAIHSLIGGATSLGEFAQQTFQDFDIIIVDDASTDDTQAIARQFLNNRIAYIRNEQNLGTAATVNVGIRKSTGTLVTFLSADDMMETTRLQKLVDSALVNPHRSIYDNLMTFKDGQRLDVMPLMDYDFDKLLYKNIIHAGVLYPRQAWQEIGGYPESFRDGREDWAFNVALGSAGYCGIHVKDPLYLYRREGQNRSLGNGGAEKRIAWLEKMRAQFPALYRGERSNMCCGGKRTAANPAQGASKSRRSRTVNEPYNVPLVADSNGMVLIEYQLPKAGSVLYTGSVTKRQYAFSMSKNRGYVDARDATALLARIEDRRRAFKLIEPEKPAEQPAPILEAAPVIAPSPTNPVELDIKPIVVTIAEEKTIKAKKGKSNA
jgi:glycosyltransferase involved in cell wall biosynthesis